MKKRRKMRRISREENMEMKLPELWNNLRKVQELLNVNLSNRLNSLNNSNSTKVEVEPTVSWLKLLCTKVEPELETEEAILRARRELSSSTWEMLPYSEDVTSKCQSWKLSLAVQ